MAKPFDFGEVKLTADEDAGVAGPVSDAPFRVALLGDFSGRESRGVSETGLAGRRPLLIDRDNFDEVLTRISPEIHLPLGDGEPLRVQFGGLDDFHPDRLIERVQLFHKLRDARARLLDPATSAGAIREFAAASQSTSESRLEPSVAPSIRGLADGNILDNVLQESEVRGLRGMTSRGNDELHEFVRRVTAPHVVETADPRHAELIDVVDRALGAQMRALLHAPAFQALEAAWRAVFLLVRRIETGPKLKLYIIDISKSELAEELTRTRDLRSTSLYQLLAEKTIAKTTDAESWALFVGDFTFGPSRRDVDLLSRMAEIASAASAPFLAAADPALLGCRSFGTAPHPHDWNLPPDADGAGAWATLRRAPESRFIGLALPRFLLRLPYGAKTEPAESVDFEEMTNPPSHEDYLWGNSAFAAALLLAQSFSEQGWQLGPDTGLEVDGLPLHVYQQDGESQLKPCAEALLTEAAAGEILRHGFMPLAWLKGQDRVRLLRLQSISDPPRALAGRWN